TALVVTRLIFDWLLAKGWLKSMKMLHIIRAAKIDFMRWAKPAFIASWLLILIGNGWGLHRGRDVLGVEFAGGDNLTLTFDAAQKPGVDNLRGVISKLSVGDVMIQYQKDLVSNKENLRITTRVVEAEKGGGQASDSARTVAEALQKNFKEANF